MECLVRLRIAGGSFPALNEAYLTGTAYEILTDEMGDSIWLVSFMRYDPSPAAVERAAPLSQRFLLHLFAGKVIRQAMFTSMKR